METSDRATRAVVEVIGHLRHSKVSLEVRLLSRGPARWLGCLVLASTARAAYQVKP
jgi:hypothetical protein